MNKKIIKRIFAALIAAIMCLGMFSMFSITAHADEPFVDDGTWISDYDTMVNRGDNDRKIVIEVIVPSDLRTTVCALMKNRETGQKYFARIEKVNGYRCNIWLPMGDYEMLGLWCPIYNDFEWETGTTYFTIYSNGNGMLTYKVKNVDSWVADEWGNLHYDETISNDNGNNNQSNPGNNTGNDNTGSNPGNNNNPNGNLGNDDIGGDNNDDNQGSTDKPNSELTREEFIAKTDKDLFDTPFDFIKMDVNGKLFYTTQYEGTSKAYMRVSGFSKKTCDGVVKIVSGGIIGEATFKISIDGGKTFLPSTYTVSNSTYISDLGLTISFVVPKDTDELYAGDTHTFKTIRTHEVSSSVSPASAIIVATGTNIEYTFEYKVEVMSSGGFGVAKIAIYDANLDTVTQADKTIIVIPEDGIVNLDNGAQLVFKDLDTYTKGQVFYVHVNSNKVEEIDYTRLYVLGGVVGFAAIVVFVILLNKKEKRTDYTINEYKGYQDEDKYK